MAATFGIYSSQTNHHFLVHLISIASRTFAALAQAGLLGFIEKVVVPVTGLFGPVRKKV